MAIAIKDILSKPLVKKDVLTSLYGLLGDLLGYPLELQDGAPVPAILDTVVGWGVDIIWNPIILPALRAPFIDYSAGEWLAQWLWTDRDVNKITAIAATGPIVLENRGSFNGTIAVGQVRIKNSTTNKTYTNTTSDTLTPWIGSGPYPTVTLTFEADEEGSAGSAAPGAIAAYPTPLVSGPVGVFARTNASPMLGSDEETDDRLKTRGRDAADLYSTGGPRGAYRAAAMAPLEVFRKFKQLPPESWGNVNPAITRVQIDEPGGSVVNVYCASDSGPAGGDALTPDTDVFKAATAIQLFVRPPGVTVNVYPANAHAVAIGTITLYVKASPTVTAASAKADADAALTLFDKLLPVGGMKKTSGGVGKVFASHVRTVAEQGAGAFASDMTFVDEAMSVGDVAQLSWTVAVNVVDQGSI